MLFRFNENTLYWRNDNCLHLLIYLTQQLLLTFLSYRSYHPTSHHITSNHNHIIIVSRHNHIISLYHITIILYDLIIMLSKRRNNSSQLMIGYSGCCKCYRCHNWLEYEKNLFHEIFKKNGNFKRIENIETLSPQELAGCRHCAFSFDR